MERENTDSETASADELHYVADREELQEGDRVIVDIEGSEIAVFDLDGQLYALANYCVHQGGPVCEGQVSGTLVADRDEDGWELRYDRDNEIIACPWHGWEFDVQTGEHLVQTGYKLPTYDVVVRDGEIYIANMGE